MFWSMVWNAFDRSSNILIVIGASLLAIRVTILSISLRPAYPIECLGLKPYWLSTRRFESLRYGDNWIKMIFSITFNIVRTR